MSGEWFTSFEGLARWPGARATTGRALVALWVALCVASVAEAALPPVEIVSGKEAAPCHMRTFFRPLAIYRDPSLFLGSFAAYVADPARGIDALLRERPLLTMLSGRVSLREVGEARAFRSFPVIQQMYGDLDRRFLSAEAPTTVPVVLCGDGDAYRDTLGFVLKADLDKAEWPDDGLPPSIEPNPVPAWKQAPTVER
jgi:hypothetical protein